MLKTFSQSEMLTYWKRRLGLKINSAVNTSGDLTELDRKLLDDIDIWYEDILRNAPAEKLLVEDVSAELSARFISDNAAEITPPERAVRLVALRMGDWQCDEVETFSVHSDIARLQRNRLTRATADEPVVLSRPGHFEAHGLTSSPYDFSQIIPSPSSPMPKTPQVDKLDMVVRPPQGYYTLDTSLMRYSQLYIS